MTDLDPTDPDIWRIVRRTVAHARVSSLHCAIASTMPDGQPHVSPIGSVRLTEPGTGVYLDVFNAQLGRNIDHDARITIMAVDSSKRTWLTALLRGTFETPPGVRLTAIAGPSRPATDAEIERFRSSVRPALMTRGGRAMWGRTDGVRARDLTVSGVDPVRIGATTRGLWRTGTRRPATAVVT